MSSDNTVRIPAEEAAEKYLEHRKTEVRDDTVRGESTPVRKFAEWIEDNEKELHQLNGFELQSFYDHLKKQEYAKVTLRNYMGAVRQFLFYLERLDAAPPGIGEKVHIPTLEKDDRRRSEEIDPERVQKIIDWLGKYRYASRDHVLMLILWHCGLRRGSVYSLDLQDFTQLEGSGPALVLNNREDTGTPLKNGEDGERPVNLNEDVAEVIQDYIDHNRIEQTDEHGRKPLITSRYGRYSKDQYRKTCLYFTCPEVTDIGTCSCSEPPAKEYAYECSKSVSPHVIRSASITYWRHNDVPVEVVSDRMNVSRNIIEEHYDRRTEEGKARQRRRYLNNI